jgi:hypothetical protein
MTGISKFSGLTGSRSVALLLCSSLLDVMPVVVGLNKNKFLLK